MAEKSKILPLNAKLLALSIFLLLFIEIGTLGILPSTYYFVYRNVRISDLLLYAIIIYSLFCIREYRDLFWSKLFIIVRLLLLYMVLQFLISVIVYKVEIIEYFFRLKLLWFSFLVFPYMLLLKRNGITYLVKLIFPFAIASNILYILTALSGIAFLPDVTLVQQNLPGGLKVWRVFGGTFYGELFMLGIIYYWNEYKFKLVHVPFVIIFGLPHILAFGRGTWIFLVFAISFITIWSTFKKRDFKTAVRQVVMVSVTVAVFFYAFNKFLPEPEEMSEAITSRIEQGSDDIKYSEGTIGTRLANLKSLLNLWSANPVFGIGMHPFWVIKPVTTEEAIYYWGFNDLRWVSVLVAYGAVGLLFAIIFQIMFIYMCFKLLKRIHVMNINYFLVLMFLILMLRDSLINYMFYLTSISIYAFSSLNALFIANVIYLYEKYKSNSDIKEEKNIQISQQRTF